MLYYTKHPYIIIRQKNEDFMDITVRKLAGGDDFAKAARLIYETDNYIFPHFFDDDAGLAVAILPKMFEVGTIYNKENIYVALFNEQIIGVIALVPTPISINLGAFIEAYEMAGGMIDERFQKVMIEYFSPMETLPEGYYIASLCIDEPYRGQGIARAMLDYIFENIDKTKDIYLDCLSDNERAIMVYTACNFEKLFEFDGFTGLKYHKMIRRANREI